MANPLEQLNQATAALEASREAGSNKEKQAAIDTWWTDAHKVFRQNPEAFQAWSQNNPEMAIRWHARAANDNVNTGWDSKQHDQLAKAIAIGHGQALGMGDDMKENGRMLATDYKSFKDVNSEWGPGDFWKIGTPQTLDKGFGAFVDSLDLKDVAMMAAPFIVGPLIGPALAGMGLSPTMTAGLTNAMMQGLKGGDLKDILISGATPFVNAGMGKLIDSALYGTPMGDALLQKGWDLNAISQGVQKGGMEWLKGNDLQDIILGGLEEYVDAGGGLGNLPGPGLPDFDMPDWMPEGDWELFEGAKDLFGDVGDWTSDKWDQFKDWMPDVNLPGLPDWQGPDWNPDMPEMGMPEWAKNIDWPNMPGMPDIDWPNISLPDMPNMPGMPNRPGMPATAPTGMMAPQTPTELAKLNAMPDVRPVRQMGPWIYNAEGMMG